MHRIAPRVLVTAGALLLAAASLGAQATEQPSGRPVTIGGALGATLPTGDFGEFADVGYHLGGLVEYSQATWPFTLRAEATYHRNGLSDVDGNASILSFVPNIVIPFGDAAATARPYIIGGVGLYRAKIDADELGSDTETKIGFNVGGGFRFPLSGFTTFVEARFHTVRTSDNSTNFIPLSFGFTF
jgi:hypothetical protein